VGDYTPATGRLCPRIAVLGLLVIAGCSGAPTATQQSDHETTNVTVTRIVDGDTLEIEYANGTSDTARLIGVDTPEVHVENAPEEFEGVPDTDAGAACLRDAGENATSFATERLADRTVTITTDRNTDRRGYYGRLLVYVTVQDRLFNRQLIMTGHARVYNSDFTRHERFLDAERTARDKRRGLWKCINLAS
jgi:micrococcal nuclease